MWSGHVGVSVWKSPARWPILLEAQARVAKRARRERQCASLKVPPDKRVFDETELAARVRVCFVAKHVRDSRGQLPWAGRD